MSSRPTGSVTFLFTDIEGSTRLWEERASDMEAALEWHDRVLRAAIESNGGYIFATGGDGFAAAFSRAADAVSAAEKAQAHLRSHEFIKVRMGLHSGAAQERDGDYFGPAVNKAARVMAAGHGGQILATHALAEGVGIQGFIDMGERRLRDLSGPQRIFQLGPGEFPKLRTIDAYPSNLPQKLSSFVGRDDDVQKIIGDLRSNVLVTLTGVGGVGKTRLAIQTCAEALPRFPDGAWFVDLASVRDPVQVTPTVAAVLDVKEHAGEALAITLRDALLERRAIILLDNCEHLVDEVAGLIERLTNRPLAARFLLTTREPLGIDGEKVRRVASLESDVSVELFVQRASSVRSTSTGPRTNASCTRFAIASTAFHWPSSSPRRGPGRCYPPTSCVASTSDSGCFRDRNARRANAIKRCLQLSNGRTTC